MTTETTNSNVSRTTRAKATEADKGRAKATKKLQLIRMLNRKGGADVATISTKLGWQQHTTRAALTGLRKSEYEIVSEKPGQGQLSRYRIAAEPTTAARWPRRGTDGARRERSG